VKSKLLSAKKTLMGSVC